MIFETDIEAVGFLDEHLNANGQIPHVTGWTADDLPVFLWLDEFGGDEIFLRACVLKVNDGGTASTPTIVYPADGVKWPVRVTTHEEDRS